jgi:hypothetical protein
MKQAMELAEKLGYPSVGTMIEFINSGTMNNLPVTAHDAALCVCGLWYTYLSVLIIESSNVLLIAQFLTTAEANLDPR